MIAAENRAFLDSIKGKVSPGAYDLICAYYALSPKAKAFVDPYIEEMTQDGADIDEIIERAKADWLRLKA